MIGLQPVMTYRFSMRGPLAATEGSPTGAREYWEMTEGRLEGEGISAQIAMPGGDWMTVSLDRFARPDVRVQFLTDDGVVILLHYIGLVERTDAFLNAAKDNRETDFGDVNMRMVLRFETGGERYQWLNESFFLAEGRLLGTHAIEYRIHRVT